MTRQYAKVAGVVIVLIGVIGLIAGERSLGGFVVPELFGLLPSGYSVVDNLIHLLLGVAGIYLGYFATRQHATTR